jgi:hypothetical protein
MRPIDAYLQKLAEGLDALPDSERDECLREVRGHLEEAASRSTALTPEQRESHAIECFGPAEEIARSLSNEMLIGAASRGFRPVTTARAMLHAMLSGASWTAAGVVLSTAYVALLLFGVVSVSRLWLPEAGLWIHPDGSWSLSFGGFSNAKELLGPWLPLYGPLITLGGWLTLNRVIQGALRAVARRRRAREAG